MGIIHVEGTARGPRGETTISFLVDSGAMYTLLPQDVWQAIGLSPRRRQRFTLADGTLIERDMSECYVLLPQGEGHSPVVLGQAGDAALLGVVTLEIFGLMLNPFTRELQPMRLMLAGLVTPAPPESTLPQERP